MGFAWVMRCLERVLDDRTVVVNEYPLDRRYIGFDRPGSFFGQPHSSGLGWGLPAALGIKLAAPDRTVIAALGDGSYLFNEPAACHFVARAQGLPVLAVIFNNGQWEAVKSSALGLYPEGWARSTDTFPLTALEPGAALRGDRARLRWPRRAGGPPGRRPRRARPGACAPCATGARPSST